MSIRTDLAVEKRGELLKSDNIKTEKIKLERVEIDRMSINFDSDEGLAKGRYVTISFDKFTPDDVWGELHTAIKTELTSLLKNNDRVLVVGLGNREITPDAIGPRVVDGIFSTRHIKKAMAEAVGLRGLRSVSAIATGVLGQTGIEAAEIILGAVEKTRPTAVIVVDALAAGNINRLGCTVQMTDSGIRPGSGVGNSRAEISEKTIGVPTVAIGVPTVVDAATFAEDLIKAEYRGGGATLMVTPRDIDTMINYSAKTIAHAINCALQPKIESSILLAL